MNAKQERTITVTGAMRDLALEGLTALRPEIAQEDAEEAVDLAIAYAASVEGFMDRCLDAEFLAEIYDQNVFERTAIDALENEVALEERGDDDER